MFSSFAASDLPSAARRRCAISGVAMACVLASAAQTLAQGTSARPPATTSAASIPAAAETGASGTSYINPFPPGDIYKLQVYGDSFAEGLLQGMSEIMRAEERVELPKKHRGLGALIRTEYEDDLKTEEQSRDVLHIEINILDVATGDYHAVLGQHHGQLVIGADVTAQGHDVRALTVIDMHRCGGVG